MQLYTSACIITQTLLCICDCRPARATNPIVNKYIACFTAVLDGMVRPLVYCILFLRVVLKCASMLFEVCGQNILHLCRSTFNRCDLPQQTLCMSPYNGGTAKQTHLLVSRWDKDEIKLICMYLNPRWIGCSD